MHAEKVQVNYFSAEFVWIGMYLSFMWLLQIYPILLGAQGPMDLLLNSNTIILIGMIAKQKTKLYNIFHIFVLQ